MRCILTILEADPYLKKVVEPHINLNTESIDWDAVFKVSPGSSSKAIMAWCFALWTDELRPKVNLFEKSLNLDPQMQLAIAKALALRWGLQS